MQDTIDVHERLAALEQHKKSVDRRLENLEKLVESVHTIATEVKEMRKEVNGVGVRMDEIESRPKKRYDTFITAVITSAVGVVVGYLIGLVL